MCHLRTVIVGESFRTNSQETVVAQYLFGRCRSTHETFVILYK